MPAVLLLFASLVAHAIDLDGRPADPFASSDARATVLIFVRTDCPISNRYAPELQRINREFSPKHVKFWVVYPGTTESPEQIRKHIAEYQLPGDPVRDLKKELVKLAQARVTPEVAVFDPTGRLVYHGRIDDRFIDFGKSRAEPTTHDLSTAIDAVLAGKPVLPAATKAIGCYISDLP